jgi:hypothetical protein
MTKIKVSKSLNLYLVSAQVTGLIDWISCQQKKIITRHTVLYTSYAHIPSSATINSIFLILIFPQHFHLTILDFT